MSPDPAGVPASNPFKGLESFDQTDALFGRDQDFTLMRERVYAGRTTLLFAASGVGKTSFLKARLLPELRDEFIICYHNQWADEIPLTAVLKAIARVTGASSAGAAQSLAEAVQGFRRASPADPLTTLQLRPTRTRPRDLLLVLDQFEEVFQYYGFREEFTAFLDQISSVINDQALCVRVVFSMRDDFLGRLSVFDNRIPDLFNNYYRLKSPTLAQAREIIRRTAATVGKEVDREGLEALVNDLSLFTRAMTKDLARERRSSRLSRVAAVLARIGNALLRVARSVFPIGGERPAKTESVRRGFVVPPYMQIVCRELWARQTAESNGQFLDRYRCSENPDTNHALVILRRFCRAQLGQLESERQRDLAAHAFQYLMTREGAKMAYQRHRLAQHMHVKSGELEPVLDRLFKNRILRRFKGVDESYWYELYHDMYAPILSDWRFEHDLKRNARRRAWTTGWVAAGLVLSLWAANVIHHRNLIRDARDAYPVRSYDALKGRVTLGLPVKWLERFADGPWAAYWDRRAIRAEALQDRDRAILLRLTALKTRPTPERQLAVDRLLGGDYARSLSLTLRAPGPVADIAFSPDERRLAAVTANGAGRMWDVITGQETGAFAVDATFLADDRVTGLDYIRTNTIITFTRDRGLAVWQPQGDAKEWQLKGCAVDVTAYAVDSGAHRLVVSSRGQVVESELSAADPFPCTTDARERIRLRSATARMAADDFVRDVGFVRDDSALLLVTGDGRVLIQRAGAGSARRQEVLKFQVAKSAPHPISISPDGKYIAAVSMRGGGTFQLFDDSGKPVGPSSTIAKPHLSDVTFSHDGRYVIVSQRFSLEYCVFDGRSGHTVKNVLPMGSLNRTLAPNLRLGAAADSAVVWVSTTDRPIASPVLREAAVSAVAFNSGGSALATAAGGAIRLWRPVPSAPLTNEFRQQPPAVGTGMDDSRSCAFLADDKAIHVQGFAGAAWQIPIAAAPQQLMAAPGCRVFAAIDRKHGLRLLRDGAPSLQLAFPGVGNPSSARLNSVAQFSPDGTRLAVWQLRNVSVELEGIALWDTRTGALVAHMRDVGSTGLRGGVTAAFTADSKSLVIVAESDRTHTAVRLLSSKDGGLLWSAQLPGVITRRIVAPRSPSDVVAIGTSAGGHLIDVSNRHVRTLPREPGQSGIDDLAFDRSGQRLAVIDQGTLTIHHLRSADRQRVVFGEPFVGAVFNPQFAHLALAVSDRGFQLFDIRAGAEPAPIGAFIFFPQASEGRADGLPSLEFTPDGTAVILADATWMHRLRSTDSGLLFEQSRLLSAPLQSNESFAVRDRAGDTVNAWLNIGDMATRLEQVDFRPNAPVPAASSRQLEDWQRKVGLRLENGQIFVGEPRR
jgi:WD40 repeat protein